MCGRFALFADDDWLVSLFGVDLLEGEHAASWNQAPSQQIRVVFDQAAPASPSSPVPASSSPPAPVPASSSSPTAPAPSRDMPRARRKLRSLQWGLVPGWARTPDRPMINARAETLVEKPSFRAAAARRRCLIPANGYFEWQAPSSGSGPKQAWFLSSGGGRSLDEGDPVVAFAGLYEAWRAPSSDPGGGAGARPVRAGREQDDGRWLLTCAIVTRAATDALGRIHDRMPVVVPPELWDAWLDPDLTDLDGVNRLLRAIPDPQLVPRRVGSAVGSVRNDGPDLIAPLGPA